MEYIISGTIKQLKLLKKREKLKEDIHYSKQPYIVTNHLPDTNLKVKERKEKDDGGRSKDTTS